MSKGSPNLVFSVSVNTTKGTAEIKKIEAAVKKLKDTSEKAKKSTGDWSQAFRLGSAMAAVNGVTFAINKLTGAYKLLVDEAAK